MGFAVRRHVFYLGRWIDHGGWYPDRKVRLFDRNRARWGGVNPHDHVLVDGPVRALSGDILHHSYRSISDHLRQIDLFTTIAAREKAEAGARFRLWRLLLHPIGKVLRMYLLKRGFLDGLAGLVVGRFKDCGRFDEIDEIVLERFGDMDIPIVSGAPFGHGRENVIVPLGVSARLDTDVSALSLPEPVFQD